MALSDEIFMNRNLIKFNFFILVMSGSYYVISTLICLDSYLLHIFPFVHLNVIFTWFLFNNPILLGLSKTTMTVGMTTKPMQLIILGGNDHHGWGYRGLIRLLMVAREEQIQWSYRSIKRLLQFLVITNVLGLLTDDTY